MSKTHTAAATCENCQTLFENLSVARDARGGYAALELTACPLCATPLCKCCPQFACDSCAATFCASHLVSVPDGTAKPLACCPACAAECEELIAPMPAQSETRIAARVEVA